MGGGGGGGGGRGGGGGGGGWGVRAFFNIFEVVFECSLTLKFPEPTTRMSEETTKAAMVENPIPRWDADNSLPYTQSRLYSHFHNSLPFYSVYSSSVL